MFKPGARVVVTLTDGSVLAGTVARSWRWRTVKLTSAHLVDPRSGPTPVDGHLLIPSRSVLVGQVGT